MLRISRRTFGKSLAASFGLAFFNPSQFVHSQLFRLFRGKGHETAPITPNADFYVTSYDLTPTVLLKQWSLAIGGMVNNPRTVSFADLMQCPQTTLISTLECIGNPVGGYSIGTAAWQGVTLNYLLDAAGLNPKAVDVVLRGADGYSDSVPLSRARDDDVLLATYMNGVPLPPDHGFPARVIVPGIYGMKNVKWLTGLELVDYDYKGYWQQQSWSDTALVKLSSRIDVPGDRELITTPQYTMKGIAFHGNNQIHMIEVSTDEGQTWKKSTLLPKLSPYTWTPWSYEWIIPQSGEHTIMARATNVHGLTQSLQPTRPLGEVVELHAITVNVDIER